MKTMTLIFGIAILLRIGAGELQFCQADTKEQARLLEMAECALSAYPGEKVPSGYEAFSESNCEMCVLGRHYEGCEFKGNGYLEMSSGLRARLMKKTSTGDIVVAFSGCDLHPQTVVSAGKFDAIAVGKMFWGNIEGQYRQASDVLKGLILSTCHNINIVGHSLGGSIAVYTLVSTDDGKDRVRVTTFNALGISEKTEKKFFTDYRSRLASNNVVNVMMASDPVYNKLPARHYGKTYSISSGEVSMLNIKESHGLDALIDRIKSIIHGCQNGASGETRYRADLSNTRESGESGCKVMSVGASGGINLKSDRAPTGNLKSGTAIIVDEDD